MAKFKSANPDGHGVTIWAPSLPEIRIPTDGVYETTNDAEIESLRANGMVVEVREQAKHKETDSKPKDDK